MVQAEGPETEQNCQSCIYAGRGEAALMIKDGCMTKDGCVQRGLIHSIIFFYKI